MRITEAAARLGMSPRMLRYREDLGLLPPLRDRPTGRGPSHRQFTDDDVAAIMAAVRIEQRYDITPAALAFGLRVLAEPAVRAAVADLGRRTGHVPPGPGASRALDFEKERALRALGTAGAPGTGPRTTAAEPLPAPRNDHDDLGAPPESGRLAAVSEVHRHRPHRWLTRQECGPGPVASASGPAAGLRPGISGRFRT